jgi:hypothetical protein
LGINVGENKYLKECMVPLICRFLLLGSADSTLLTKTITLSTNMGRDLDLHRIVRGTSIAVYTEASRIPRLISNFDRVGMCFPGFLVSSVVWQNARKKNINSTAALNSRNCSETVALGEVEMK